MGKREEGSESGRYSILALSLIRMLRFAMFVDAKPNTDMGSDVIDIRLRPRGCVIT